MKKFKIFLMISLLVCFGFALSFDVHASGPKVFEVGEVLPATTQLRLTVDFSDMPKNEVYDFETTNGYFFGWARYAEAPGSIVMIDDSAVDPASVSSDGLIITYVLDISSLTETQRTVYRFNGGYWTWEDLNASSGYTISFNSNGGSTISDIEEATELPNPLPPTTKSGYTFGGWYYDSTSTQIATAGDTIESNVTLYAKWELNTYTITYNSNGGSGIPQTSNATKLPTPLPTPTKSGYTFVGWYYASAFTQIANPGDTLESNVTLYAKWGRTFAHKIFEVGDVLSPGQIKISWDFSDITISEDDFIRIEGTNDFAIYMAVEDVANSVEMWIMGYYTDIIKGNIMINLDDISVITEIKGDGNSDFWDIIDALTWEYIGDYQDGYDVGYTSAREYYGFYDSSTNEWLSVTEYIDRYGTDKMNQTDFYNNFDKYFIPAMIIVFGGAIVLTILKVFKGRE